MKRQILLVDGYNMIGAWPELVTLKNQDKMEDARDLLLFKLSNYAKYHDIQVIVVFDAQFVPGLSKEYRKYQLTVVFTGIDETADTYIERRAGELVSRLTLVTVATSDLAEQWLIFSKGALRQSAKELWRDLEETKVAIVNDTKDYHYQNQRRAGTWRPEQLNKLDKLLEDLSQ